MNELLVRVMSIGAIQSNCYVAGSLAGGRGVIIDPGGEADRVWEMFRDTGLELAAIVVTHSHFDHAGGLKRLREFTAAPLLAHRADAPMLRHLKTQAMFFMMSADNAPEPDRLLEDGDEIDLGDGSLTVLHTPGHTPGGIALFAPGVVFTGDSLFSGSIGRTDLPGGNGRELLRSIQSKLLALPDETIVYPGHGPSTTIGRERRSNPFLG